MEINKERADKRRAQAAKDRERRFNEFFDGIVAERYGSARAAAVPIVVRDVTRGCCCQP